MRTSRLIAPVAAALLFLGVPAAAASAHEGPTVTANASKGAVLTIEDLTARFAELGVDESAWPGLIAKVQRGELPDSDIGANPVSTETTNRGGVATTRTIYADGSVSLASAPSTAAQAPSGGMTPYGVDNCSTSETASVITKSNCYVSYNAATWSGSYQMKTIRYGKMGPTSTYINGVSNVISGGVGVTGKKVVIQNSGGLDVTAIARMSMKQSITIAGVGLNRDVGFELKVTPTGGPRVYGFQS